MRDLELRVRDREARALDSPVERSRVLADRLRFGPLCETCGGDGMRRRGSDEASWACHNHRAGVLSCGPTCEVWRSCLRCAGTGSPFLACLELGAYCGSEAATLALNGTLWHLETPRAFAEWVRGLSRWTDAGPVPGWVPVRAGHAAFELGLRAWNPQRDEVRGAAHEACRRVLAWLGDPGPRTLALVEAAHDGAGPFAALPFPIRAQLSGVIQFAPGRGAVARQIDPTGTSSTWHMVEWSAAFAGEAPVRAAIQTSLVAWALGGEP